MSEHHKRNVDERRKKLLVPDIKGGVDQKRIEAIQRMKAEAFELAQHLNQRRINAANIAGRYYEQTSPRPERPSEAIIVLAAEIELYLERGWREYITVEQKDEGDATE